MQNIVMMYKRDIGNKIYKQMLQHFYCENGFLQEEVIGTEITTWNSIITLVSVSAFFLTCGKNPVRSL